MVRDRTRRRVLAGTGSVVATTLAGCSGSSNDGNDDGGGDGGDGDGGGGGDGGGDGGTENSTPAWPVFGADAQNTGHNTGTTGPKDGIQVAWTTEVDQKLRGAPVVADDTVFVRSSDKSLYALDAASGDREWDARCPGKRTPTVVDGTVYASSWYERVVAFDAETGDTRWSQPERVQTSPLVVDGSVYVGGAQQGTQDGKDIGTNPIYKYDAESGDREVLRDYYGDQSVNFPEAFAHYDGSLIFTSENSVRSVDLATGDQEWRFDSAGESVDMSRGNAVVVDGTVYATDVTDNGEPYVYAIDAETGDQEWRFHDSEITQIEAGPSVADGTVYFLHSKSITALNAGSGERLWTEKLRGLVGVVQDTPTIVDGVVYVNGSNAIIAVDGETGEKLWQFDYEEYLREAQLAVLEDTIYAIRDNAVVAFEGV